MSASGLTLADVLQPAWRVSPRVRAYLCAVPGCAGRYYYKRDLQRHVRKKHAFAVRTAAAAAAKVEACSAGRAASKVPGRRLVR